MKAKYIKPIVRDLDNLTPAIGTCSTGAADGGCISGGSAGGALGCSTGAFASPPGCHIGNSAFTTCDTGGFVV
jgi:hypothetical protein